MIRKINAFQTFEFDYEEKWLNDLVHDGLLLTGRGTLTYHFAPSEGRDRRYRIIPKKRDDFSEEEMGLFTDSGWEFLFESNQKSIFYSDDPESPEIFSDGESYRAYMKRTAGKYLRCFVLSLFVIAIWAGNLYLNLSIDHNGLTGLADQGLWSELGYCSLILVLILCWIYDGLGYLQARRRILGAGNPSGAGTYGTKQTANRVRVTLLSLVIVAALAGVFADPSEIKGAAAMTYNEPCPVLFRTFDPEGWALVSDNLTPISSGADRTVEYDYSLYKATNSVLLVRGVEESFYASVFQNVDEAEEVRYPEYSSLTYEFRSERTAEKLLLREIGSDIGNARDMDAAREQAARIALNVPGTDYAGAYEVTESGYHWQYLYLRKGTRVVYASYHGDKKLLDALPLFTEQVLHSDLF